MCGPPGRRQNGSLTRARRARPERWRGREIVFRHGDLLLELVAEEPMDANADRELVFGRITNLVDEEYAEVFGFPALGRGAYGGFRVSF